MKPVKSNRVVGAIKAIPVWFRPKYHPWCSFPEDWFVIKMSGDRVGYIETRFVQ